MKRYYRSALFCNDFC